MSRKLLCSAAAKAGITEEQAEMFVREIINPSGLMADVGREFRTMGLFDDPPPHLHGLTWGEWNGAEAAFRWRFMCVALLAGRDHPGPWAHEPAKDPAPDTPERLAALETELNEIGATKAAA